MEPITFNRQQALADGYTPDQIDTYIASRKQQGVNLVDSTPTPPVQQPQQNGGGILDWLPLIGAVGGSFIPGLGNIVGGAVGAGAGALAKNLLDKKQGVDVGDIAKETALGGAGGVLGKAAGFVGGKALDLLGGSLGKLGEGIGIKGLRLNPSQIANFQSKHGEDIGKFLSSEGALGKDAASIATEHIQPLQEQFNAIAKNSGLKVDPNTFLKNIDDQAQKLISAGGSENLQIANDLRNEALYVWQNDLSPANFDISKVDSLRANFAKKVNWQDPNKSTLNFAMADALRKTAIDTADQAGVKGGNLGLRDIGIKLSKYRDLENAAIRQEALGRGNLPVGLSRALGFIAGEGLAGGMGGGLAGAAATSVLNNPKTLQLFAKGAAKGGDLLSSRSSPNLLQTVAGRGLAQGAVRAPFAAGSQDVLGTQMPSSIPDINSVDTTSNDQQDNLRKILATIILANAKNPSDLVAGFNLLSPASSNVGKVSAQNVSTAKAGLTNLKDVRQMLGQDPSLLAKQLIPGQFFSRKLDSALYDLADTLLRLRTGAQANPAEIRGYMQKIAPSFGDTPDVINYKLDKLQNDLTSYLNPSS